MSAVEREVAEIVIDKAFEEAKALLIAWDKEDPFFIYQLAAVLANGVNRLCHVHQSFGSAD